VLQLEAGALLNEKLLPPAIFEAKVEIFLVTFWLLHAGQTTSLTALALRTSSSNGQPHSAHTNSKMGIVLFSCEVFYTSNFRCTTGQKVATATG
jgi:hypothetical protein